MIGEILGLILLGLVVGALGRLLHPGRDRMPLWLTIAIGVASSLLVGLLIPGHGALTFILAVVVAVVLVASVSGRRRHSFRRF